MIPEPEAIKDIAKEVVTFIQQKTSQTDAKTMMLIWSYVLAIMLNNIQDNVSEDDCYYNIECVHEVIDRMSYFYHARATLPKDKRPNI